MDPRIKYIEYRKKCLKQRKKALDFKTWNKHRKMKKAAIIAGASVGGAAAINYGGGAIYNKKVNGTWKPGKGGLIGSVIRDRKRTAKLDNNPIKKNSSRANMKSNLYALRFIASQSADSQSTTSKPTTDEVKQEFNDFIRKKNKIQNASYDVLEDMVIEEAINDAYNDLADLFL